MKKGFPYIIAVSFLFFPVLLKAQAMTTNDDALARKYPFIRTVFNRVLNSSGLDSFYAKLYRLKTTGSGTVSIVHIGDSHIQADFLSGTVRKGLQDFFGDAGRGLVFPYQLAQSNAPDDISSSSNTHWQFNRLAHPELPLNYGISGYGLHTYNSGANINLSIRFGLSSFNRLKFFTDSSSWIMQADNNDVPYVVKKEEGDSSVYQQVVLDQPASSFTISSLPSFASKDFYGVSLENSQPGILYHMIGVNGARYDQYNEASLFWQQLPGLKADLYIVSLGTNEAQQAALPASAFSRELTEFIQRLKESSPGACILITTAPDSYKKRRFNTVLRDVNTALTTFSNTSYIPLWDLYHITNGYGSAYSWARRGLMSHDRIHFTAEGYRLQGNLLLIALAKGYNGFVNSYPQNP
jgi:lysophospholipase L1-like esterase